MSEIEKIIKETAEEKAIALEKFIELRLNHIPPRFWNDVKLIRTVKIENNKIITTWSVQYIKTEE